ncbi:hypothetical protein SGFS_026960 [Streptomyces graminofaciens]|uniref:Uncharacterized protein n=1 Tax=Streptomyces graminofaciens TaxID=68212 RepID=A0ABN5VDT5_9ACTN|nr:hypothetical protein SGFS_026960 [Streptomyces graminofaciens]
MSVVKGTGTVATRACFESGVVRPEGGEVASLVGCGASWPVAQFPAPLQGRGCSTPASIRSPTILLAKAEASSAA